MRWGSLDLQEYQDFECAPFVDPVIWENKERKYATCFKPSQLKKIIKAYNKKHPQNSIVIESDDQYLLWESIRSRLSADCEDSDVCWTSLPFMNTFLSPEELEKMKSQFRPRLPIEKNGKTHEVWLSNFDIDNVMRQYEIVYPNFKFIGCFPCDWAKYMNNYALDAETIIKLLNSGFNQLAVIFNTGTLSSGGQHWVCVFMDLKDNMSIEYFDSVGNKCQKNIRAWLDKTQDLINNTCKRDKKYYCEKKISRQTYNGNHQKRGGECGVYCLYFIVRRLYGDTYKEIDTVKIPDETMSLLRIVFFRHPDNDNKKHDYDFKNLKNSYLKKAGSNGRKEHFIDR